MTFFKNIPLISSAGCPSEQFDILILTCGTSEDNGSGISVLDSWNWVCIEFSPYREKYKSMKHIPVHTAAFNKTTRLCFIGSIQRKFNLNRVLVYWCTEPRRFLVLEFTVPRAFYQFLFSLISADRICRMGKQDAPDLPQADEVRTGLKPTEGREPTIKNQLRTKTVSIESFRLFTHPWIKRFSL